MKLGDNHMLIASSLPPESEEPPSSNEVTDGRRPSVKKKGGSIGTNNHNSRQRVQLEFAPGAFVRLHEIKQLANASTNAEVVRNALRLYEWFLKQRAEGYKHQLVKDNQVKEVEIVF
jgi:hypothetical protein